MPEPWLRGAVPDVAPIFQPVVHVLMQVREDVRRVLDGFPDERLEVRPGGVASVRFHLRHMAGVLDRMATYARGEALSPDQFAALSHEESPGDETAEALVAAFEAAIDAVVAQVRDTDPGTAHEARGVGRQALPSTVLGTLFHAAEHVQRHVGALLVTARVVSERP